MANETFTTYDVVSAIEEFLAYGEKTCDPNKPDGTPGHRGYYSGSGWPARVLRYHAEQLNAAEVERRKVEQEKKFSPKQNNAAANIQLARLYLNLETVRALILNEILPVAVRLQMPDEELLQTLDLAADNIERHLSEFKLTSGREVIR